MLQWRPATHTTRSLRHILSQYYLELLLSSALIAKCDYRGLNDITQMYINYCMYYLYAFDIQITRLGQRLVIVERIWAKSPNLRFFNLQKRLPCNKRICLIVRSRFYFLILNSRNSLRIQFWMSSNYHDKQ